MLAILVAALGVPAFALRRRYPSGAVVPLAKLLVEDDVDIDLPCPWCRAPTAEADTACVSCGRRFGAA